MGNHLIIWFSQLLTDPYIYTHSMLWLLCFCFTYSALTSATLIPSEVGISPKYVNLLNLPVMWNKKNLKQGKSRFKQ